MSDPQQPHGLQPTRLLHPWDFPGRSTGVACHCLLRKPGEIWTNWDQLVTLGQEKKAAEISWLLPSSFFSVSSQYHPLAGAGMRSFWEISCRGQTHCPTEQSKQKARDGLVGWWAQDWHSHVTDGKTWVKGQQTIAAWLFE